MLVRLVFIIQTLHGKAFHSKSPRTERHSTSVGLWTLTEEFSVFITRNIIPAKVNLVRYHGAMLDIVEIVRGAALPELCSLQLLSVMDPDPDAFLFVRWEESTICWH